MKYSLILSMFFAFFSCQNNTNQTSVNDTSSSIFDLHKDFKIISNNKVISEEGSEMELLACKEWNIEKGNLKKIMQSMNSIQGEEWHHLFSHLACEINGELIQNKNTFNYAINSGSWISIHNQDTTLWFGDMNKINEALFMDSVLDMENEK